MQLLIECTTEQQDALLHDFCIFACERLEIVDSPSFTFVEHTGGTSFGSYQPSEEAIIVAVEGRHTSDILRTLGHELVHHKQLSEGENEMTLEELEYEANAVAGMLMRDYNKLHPEMFGLAVATEAPPGSIGDSQGSTFPDPTRPSGPINMAETHELILWGLPKGKTDRLHEVILSTQCKTQEELGKIKVRATKDGFHGFRVSHLDLSKKPDFTKGLNIKEEGMVNSAGSGAIAGIGIGPQGEPGIPKKKKPVMLKRFKQLREETRS